MPEEKEVTPNPEKPETLTEPVTPDEAPKRGRGRPRKDGTTGPRLKREKPAHLAKVERAQSELPELSVDADEVFASALELSNGGLSNLIAHLQLELRRRAITATNDEIAPNFAIGDEVTIVGSSNPKFLGKIGVVERVQRIRCYVKFDDREKADYFFKNDCQPTITALENSENSGEDMNELAATGT